METADQQTESIGLVGRMLRTFTSPSETFEAVQQGHSAKDWLVPVLLAALVATGSQYMNMPIQQKMQAKAVAEMNAGQNMTDEQIAQQREAMEKMAGVSSVASLIGVPVVTFIMVFIFSGVLLLIARFGLGGDVSYGQMLAVEGYAMLISIPHNIILTPIREARETLMVTLGPGLLLSEEAGATFIGRMIGGIDIFQLWQIVVVAVGVSILAKASFGKTLSILLAVWALFLAGGAALGGLIPGM